MSRISRKQIKRDEMVETVGSVVDYSRQHSRGILWGVVAVAALLLLAGGFVLWQQRQRDQAIELLGRAMELHAEEGSAEEARSLFEQVLERYPRSRAADVARLYLGAFAAADGDVERARELWAVTVRRRAGSAFALQARLNLWELDRAQGRHDELVAEIRSLLETDQSELPADQLLYQLAVTLEAKGSPAEAREVYEQLADDHPLSALRDIARQRADSLSPSTGLG